MRRGEGDGEPSRTVSGLLLIGPLLLFTLLTFVLPIGLTLVRAFHDHALTDSLPRTAAALTDWDGNGMPGDAVAATFVREVRAARGSETLSMAASRLNTDISGFRSVLQRTARMLPDTVTDPYAALRAIDPNWGERPYWAAMRRATGPVTGYFLLASLDLQHDDDGHITGVPPERAVFMTVLLRTLWIAAVVTVACLVLGYPVAYLLASAPGWIANPLMLLVLIPFWTSLLVRTTAWVVLLQREGVVNSLLLHLHIIREPLSLIYNRLGVYIAITHILLPLMILPLYSVMKGIGPAPMRAAMSLGARPLTAFRRVYLPQTRPGLIAGCLLVYISALGYYVTPQLLGGGGDQLISYFIAFYTNQTMNWGLAAALSFVLLAVTLVLFAVYMLVADRRDTKPLAGA